MLDDVAAVRYDAGHQELLRRKRHALPNVVLVLVPRVGRLERVRPSVHLEDQVDEVRQRRIVNARAFVDAIARVVAHTLWRNALESAVDRRYVQLALLAALVLG